MPDHQGNGFGGIHGGSAADTDDEIGLLTDAQVSRFHDCLHGRVLFNFREFHPRDAELFEGMSHVVERTTSSRAALTCHDQRSFAESRELRRVTLNTVFFRVHLCRHIKIHKAPPDQSAVLLALFGDLIVPDGPELGRLDDSLERIAGVNEDLRHVFHGDLAGSLYNDLSAAAGSVINCQ